MGTIKTKTCINCGEFFETVDGRKRSCPACEAKAKEFIDFFEEYRKQWFQVQDELANDRYIKVE